MTDSLQLYGTLLAALCEHIPRSTFGNVCRLMGLAWAVVGLCLTGTVNFNKWGEVVISEAQYASSHQRRFQVRKNLPGSYCGVSGQVNQAIKIMEYFI